MRVGLGLMPEVARGDTLLLAAAVGDRLGTNLVGTRGSTCDMCRGDDGFGLGDTDDRVGVGTTALLGTTCDGTRDVMCASDAGMEGRFPNCTTGRVGLVEVDARGERGERGERDTARGDVEVAAVGPRGDLTFALAG